jgi:cation diffusion facilitator CzcD-associated flavoprotein CzcO
MKKETPEFPHHSHILDYYYNYAKHFKLLDKIKYNEYIIKTYKINYKNKIIWKIETKTNIYYSTNLIVASGTVNNNLHIPKDEYYKHFTGKIYHADEFKKIRNTLINKRILLVGVSETSCDLAVILKNNNKISISSRKGVWMQNRTLGANSPADMLYNRYSQQCINILGDKLYQKTFFIPFYDLSLKMWGNYGHSIPEWTPKDTYLNSIWNKNRDIINFISKGEIKPQGEIINIDNKTVYFKNKKSEEFDIIIFGTGYKPFGGLDFLDTKYYSHLYKHIFSLEDSNLYFIGFIRPFVTGIPMIAELQSRWIAQEIKNKNSGLPNKTKMLKIIESDIYIQKKKFPLYTKHITMNTIINPYKYCHEIAKNINAIPNLWKYLFTNWDLYVKLEFHSWNHHFYRLNDSNKEKQQIALDNINSYSKNESSKYIKKISIYSIILSSLLYIFIISFILFLKKSICKKE